MKGVDVKEKLKKNGYKMNEVAVLMGETPQSLNSLFQAGDIKTGVLERIAKAINKSIYFFFEEKEMDHTSNHENRIDKLIDLALSQQRTIENLSQNGENYVVAVGSDDVAQDV
jgi:transcriptional regulator with XRE-family HTH domain